MNTVRAATDNFSISNKLGQGGFGPVYKVRDVLSWSVLFYCSVEDDSMSATFLSREFCQIRRK